jgi:hypothetical protein
MIDRLLIALAIAATSTVAGGGVRTLEAARHAGRARSRSPAIGL